MRKHCACKEKKNKRKKPKKKPRQKLKTKKRKAKKRKTKKRKKPFGIVLEAKWYDLMKGRNPSKTLEYREDSAYWRKRLLKLKGRQVRLYRGMTKTSCVKTFVCVFLGGGSRFARPYNIYIFGGHQPWYCPVKLPLYFINYFWKTVPQLV